jgi:predicted AAA+ superfamily ATPase
MSKPKSRASWVARNVESQLQVTMRHFAAVLISGPRAIGKTSLARRHTKGFLALDVPMNAQAAQIDPDGLLVRQEFPLTIDEWQEAPQILGAVKRMIDAGLPPGQILITGSSDSSNRKELWPGTGRWVELKLFGLTQREIDKSSNVLLAQLFGGTLDLENIDSSKLRIDDYLALAAKSGYPSLALTNVPGEMVSDYLRSTAQVSCSRDASALGLEVDSSKLYGYLQAMAATACQQPTDMSLQQAAKVSAPTAGKYEQALQQVGLVVRIPAWSTNSVTRLSKASKIAFLDTGLLMAVNGWSLEELELDGSKRGQIIENFVLQQLRPEVELAGASMHHLRNSSGTHEIDLLIEDRQGNLVAIEVKSSMSVNDDDARHLRWLMKEQPDKVKAAVIFYAGPHVLRLRNGVIALPISTLWF